MARSSGLRALRPLRGLVHSGSIPGLVGAETLGAVIEDLGRPLSRGLMLRLEAPLRSGRLQLVSTTEDLAPVSTPPKSQREDAAAGEERPKIRQRVIDAGERYIERAGKVLRLLAR